MKFQVKKKVPTSSVDFDKEVGGGEVHGGFAAKYLVCAGAAF